MSAVWFRTRADLRSHWRAWATLALLVGLMGGGVTAAAAGARRTDSAYPRMLTATGAPNVWSFDNGDPRFPHITKDQLAGLPQVADLADFGIYTVADPPDGSLIASPDPKFGQTLFRHKMLAGRLPRPDRADEMMVSFTMAERLHLHVGDTVRLSVGSDRASGGLPLSFRLVGIEASAAEFPPETGAGASGNVAWATAAFAMAHADLKATSLVAMRLSHGDRDTPSLRGDVDRLAGGKTPYLVDIADSSANTEHAIHLQAVALWLLAGLLLVAGVVVIAQLLARQRQLESAEFSGLRALGMSRAQLWALGVAPTVGIGVAGGALAAATALALSPLTPVGLSRIAEPHPGLAFDAVALGPGALATVGLVTIAGAWAAWRVAGAAPGSRPGEPGGRSRPSAVAEALSRGSAPVPVTAGARLALEPGRGRTAVPVRSTLTGAIIGVTAISTALGFTASLNHLLADPRLYGVTWDAEINPVNGRDINSVLLGVRDDPDVVDLSSGTSSFTVDIGPLHVGGMALASTRGPSLLPAPLEGRLPARPDEVMLGRATMTSLHAYMGGTLPMSISDTNREPVSMKVVGVAVFPPINTNMGLGRGWP